MRSRSVIFGAARGVLVAGVCLGAGLPVFTTSASADASSAGGTIVVGLPVDVDTLVPWEAITINTVKVVDLLYNGLTGFDGNMQVVPELAESWETSDDALQLSFHLREGVTFRDGSPLTSADVKYTIETILDPDSGAVSASDLAVVESVDTPDPLTVVFNLSSPNAALPANLAQTPLTIVKEGATKEELGNTPNGTGPFVFADRVANQSVVLERNDNYWVPGEPLLDAIEFRVVPDQTSLATAVQSGNVNLAAFDDPLVALTLESSTVHVTQTLQQHYHAIILNSTTGPLADVNARLALQCAIDRQEVIDTAAAGAGEITGPFYTDPWRSDPNDQPCPERDLDMVAEYLEMAGAPDGFEFDMVVSSDLYATGVDIAQNLQAQLAGSNITVNLDVLESGAYIDSWSDPTTRDAVLVLAGGNSPDPESLYGPYFAEGGRRAAVAGYSSPALQQLFADGRAASDETERQAIYDQVSTELVENAVWIWLFQSYEYTVTTENVQGFVPDPIGSLQSLARTTLN